MQRASEWSLNNDQYQLVLYGLRCLAAYHAGRGGRSFADHTTTGFGLLTRQRNFGRSAARSRWQSIIPRRILVFMTHSLIFDHMFQLPLPVAEKLLRPVIVYLVLVLLLRLFGKREMAQLNPFDLVVLLSLSNTVQNAIIGDDNSVTGGVIGAFGLMAINWIVVRIAFRSRRLNHMLQGRATILIRNGQVDKQALERESMTRHELLEVIHRQGFEAFHQVRLCELDTNGSFYVEAYEPSIADKRHDELLGRLDLLTREVAELRAGPAGQ